MQSKPMERRTFGANVIEPHTRPMESGAHTIYHFHDSASLRSNAMLSRSMYMFMMQALLQLAWGGW